MAHRGVLVLRADMMQRTITAECNYKLGVERILNEHNKNSFYDDAHRKKTQHNAEGTTRRQATTTTTAADDDDDDDDDDVLLVITCGRYGGVKIDSVTVAGHHAPIFHVKGATCLDKCDIGTNGARSRSTSTSTSTSGSRLITGKFAVSLGSRDELRAKLREEEATHVQNTGRKKRPKLVLSFDYVYTRKTQGNDNDHDGDDEEEKEKEKDAGLNRTHASPADACLEEWWVVSSGLEPEEDACLPGVAVLAPLHQEKDEKQQKKQEEKREDDASISTVNLAQFSQPRPLRCLYSLVVQCDARMYVIASGVLQEQHAFASTLERAWCYELPVECEPGDFGLLIAPAVLVPAGPDAPWLTLATTTAQFTGNSNVAAVRELSDSIVRIVHFIEAYIERPLPTLALHVCVVPAELAPRCTWATTGVTFVSEIELCGPNADTERRMDARVRLSRAIAQQWFGLGGARPEDIKRDTWLLEGLCAHVALDAIKAEFGPNEATWRLWNAERELIAAFAKSQVATVAALKAAKKRQQQQQQQTGAAGGGVSTSASGSTTGTIRWRGLPHLMLMTETDRALSKRRTSMSAESLWSTRAGMVIELLSRHGPNDDILRDVIRRLFRAGARSPRLSADTFIAKFASGCGEAMSPDALLLFRRRWIESNAIPQIEIGTLYDTNKGYLHIACRQDQVGFLPDRREEDAGGYVMLEIHTRKQAAVPQQHRVILRRRRVLREEKFIYIKKLAKKAQEEALQQQQRPNARPINPVVYIIADPQGTWLANVDMRQPEMFLSSALRNERVPRSRLALLESAERFFVRVPRRKNAQPSTGRVLVVSIYSVLVDRSEFPRIRQRAAEVLAGAGAREAPGAGLAQLIRYFRASKVAPGGAIIANDFSMRADHCVLRSVCKSMARGITHLHGQLRSGMFDAVTTSALVVLMRDAASLLLSALQSNDNRRNTFDDTEWLMMLAECVGLLLRCKDASGWMPGDMTAGAVAGLDALVTMVTCHMATRDAVDQGQRHQRQQQGETMTQVQLVSECCRTAAESFVALTSRLTDDDALLGAETMLETWATRASRVSPLGTLQIRAASAMLVSRRGSTALEKFIVTKLFRPVMKSDADGMHFVAVNAARRAIIGARPRIAKTDFPLAVLSAELEGLLQRGLIRGDARRALVMLQRIASGGKEAVTMPRMYHALDTTLIGGTTLADKREAERFMQQKKLLVKIRQPVEGTGTDAQRTKLPQKKKKIKIKKPVRSGGGDAGSMPSQPKKQKKMKITLKKKSSAALATPSPTAAPAPDSAPVGSAPPVSGKAAHTAAEAVAPPPPPCATLPSVEGGGDEPRAHQGVQASEPAKPAPKVRKLKIRVGSKKRMRDEEDTKQETPGA